MEGWLDPFAGRNSPAEGTNDINPKMPAGCHVDAVEFLESFAPSSVAGVLLDPPYSARQVTEKYEGRRVKKLTRVLDAAAEVVEPGGLAISFGWNTNGLGKTRGFRLLHVTIVAHGAQHNDTLVTVEQKRS
jgi:hypothetical protein